MHFAVIISYSTISVFSLSFDYKMCREEAIIVYLDLAQQKQVGDSFKHAGSNSKTWGKYYKQGA